MRKVLFDACRHVLGTGTVTWCALTLSMSSCKFARGFVVRIVGQHSPRPLAIAASAFDLLAFIALRRDAFTI